MKAAEKDVRDFYKTNTPEELEAEIAKDERSLRRRFSSIRRKRQQDDIESRIAILRDMLKHLF